MLDPLTNIKRSTRKTSDTVEVTFYDVKAIRDDVAFIKQDYLEFKKEMRLEMARLNSSTSYSSDYFPADDNSSICRFMEEDKDFKKRKESLYLLLSGCDADKPRKFSDSFLSTLFTKNYLSKYIWPLGRYVSSTHKKSERKKERKKETQVQINVVFPVSRTARRIWWFRGHL